VPDGCTASKGGAMNLKVRGSMHWKVGGGVNSVKTLKFEKDGGRMTPQHLWWRRP